MTHGTRRCYQAGCRLLLCKAAEAQYRAALRRLRAHGKTPLGAYVSGKEAQRRIAQLLIERFTKAEIARRLGLKTTKLQLHTEVITVRNLLKVRRLYRLSLEGPDQPHV